MSEQAPGAACTAGAAAADDGGRATDVPSVSEMIALVAGEDEVVADQLTLAVAGADDLQDSWSASFERCFTVRADQLEVERIAEERVQLAAVLPVVCSFEYFDHWYANPANTLTGRSRADGVVSYVTSTFAGADALPTGWSQSDAVAEELERCGAEPLRVHSGGTLIVGEDVSPGTYRSTQPISSACYWERTSASGDIRANNFTSSAQQIVVAVSASDYSVENDGCGFGVNGELRPIAGD